VSSWGRAGTGDGEFDRPVGITIDSAGDVYIVDRFGSRIQKFHSNGSFVSSWGGQGSGDGQLNWPRGATVAAVNGTDQLYVADVNNFRIQVFDTSGGFLTKWGAKGTGPGQFDRPSGVASSPSDDIFVADTYAHRIQHFDSSGGYIGQWGSYGWPVLDCPPYSLAVEARTGPLPAPLLERIGSWPTWSGSRRGAALRRLGRRTVRCRAAFAV
jgi:hypothetical protein